MSEFIVKPLPEPDSNTVNVYRNVPAMSSFAEVTDGRLHADVPNDWWIVIADVAGSTKAIEAGAYKKVNTVGVACIAAVVNVDRAIDLPFVFGGDGAAFAVPDVLCGRVTIALRAAQRLALRTQRSILTLTGACLGRFSPSTAMWRSTIRYAWTGCNWRSARVCCPTSGGCAPGNPAFGGG